MTRLVVGCSLAVALIIAVALALSHELLRTALLAPVEYTERSRCEYSPAGPVLKGFDAQDRMPYEACDLTTCLEMEATLALRAHDLHNDRLPVEEC